MNEPGQHTFPTDMGRLLELGFVVGILSDLEKHPEIVVHFQDQYRQDLHHLSFQAVYAKLCQTTEVLSSWDKDMLERWTLFQLLRGYLAGQTFLQEYMQSFAQEKKDFPREIVYLQCNVYGSNSFDIYPKNERTAIDELMEQFPHAGITAFSLSEDERQRYSARGHFLRADILLLIRYGKQWRVLCVDVSAFALRSLADAGDLSDVETIRRLLLTEVHYAQRKSVFTNLNIDTDATETTRHLLAGKLRHYFAAFSREDKDSAKLIQAASYAESFYAFLREKNIVQAQDLITFNVVGYTDRTMNAMSLRQDQIAILETCAAIYRGAKKQSLQEERAHVFTAIGKAATFSFLPDQDGKLIEKVVGVSERGDGLHWVYHEEYLKDFVNTVEPLQPALVPEDVLQLLPLKPGENIREYHRRLIRQVLGSSIPYLFLTAHPGIGKTTAVVRFLKERWMQKEGFLFIYASPRKHVNLDIIRKFRDDEFGLQCDDVLALTSNTVIIRGNNAAPTVHYYSKKRQDRFRAHGVDFIAMESEDAQRQSRVQRHLEEVEEGLLIDKGERISGVLDSLCSATFAALDEPLSNAIVATVALQSLKSTHQGQQNTLRHLKKIFTGSARSEKPDEEQLAKIAQRIRHIVIMVDEVTGDESGAAFVHGMHTFLKQQGLLGNNAYGINTKIIVADASIVSPDIIRQHLESTTYEPDKIYFRLDDGTRSQFALTREEMLFKRLPAIAINANAYPAGALRLRYRIGIDTIPFDEEYMERRKQVQRDTHQHILQDILSTIQQPPPYQLLVYVQDKQRLARLIQSVRDAGVPFDLYRDYIEIHANISEHEKQQIERYQNEVRVVFMTASASRGLSFKNARHIVVDVPHFQIEQNLMEILQVIYRGRGGELDQEEKILTFYLSDSVFYHSEENRALARQESLLHLLNMLLILKTSLMTRLVGSGQIGREQRFLMVPIGGKSISAAGETLTSRLGRLVKELQDLSRRSWNDQRLSYVAQMLLDILREARIRLLRLSNTDHARSSGQSYIPSISSLLPLFHEAARKGFDQLLSLPTFESAYLAGSLLIVPAANHLVQEKYWTDVKALLAQQKGPYDLLTCIRELCQDKRYPDTVHMVLEEAQSFIQHLDRMTLNKTSYYEQESAHLDQHYAFPLLNFLAHDAFRTYFASKPPLEDQPETAFRSILLSYLRTFYPVDSVLPITGNYKQFPFLVFRSFHLQNARYKMFTSKYLFMSHELNILNMLLSSKEEIKETES